MTAVAHDRQGDKPEGTPRSDLLASVPLPPDPADSERPRLSESMPVRDAIADFVAKLVADAPLLPADARAHLAALLTDTTEEA
jgi:hypothetical protein